EKYSVDLVLFAHGGELEKLVPAEVNMLPPIEYTSFSNLSLKHAVVDTLKNRKYKMLISRVKFSAALRKQTCSNAQKARMYWQQAASVIEHNAKEYDVAISYAQGVPTFYTAD